VTDPFEALREPVTPVDPDPGFAGRLRTRLTREVFAPAGGTMSQQTVATPTEREPGWSPALTPYIVVSDARRAMDWYVQVFGAQRRGELYVNADPGTAGCCSGRRRGLDLPHRPTPTDRPAACAKATSRT
jgi:hypothetical protein